MKYMGSKSRIAKSIVPIIQAEIDKTGWNYFEPFCGGCNVIDKIKANKKFASDNNKYLIALWKYLQENDELPDVVSKELYSSVRDCYNAQANTYEDWYIGAVGFLASYNSRFFDGGYAGIVHTKANTVRDYYDEAKRNILTQREYIKDICFAHKQYYEVKPNNLVIYCDPPYQNTKQYATSKNFDHNKFWNTIREWNKNNIVFVSEENAPDDFKVVWAQEITRTQDNTKRFKSTEKLFTIK